MEKEDREGAMAVAVVVVVVVDFSVKVGVGGEEMVKVIANDSFWAEKGNREKGNGKWWEGE